MTAKEFEILSPESKEKELSQCGIYLMSRENFIYNVSLYAVNNFYVEVSYLMITGEIDRIEAVNDEKVMKHYLDRILVRI